MDIALVEAVPEAVQRQVREGKLAAQLAMKYLAPVARLKLDDCERMAAAFAAQHCTTREAGQLYTAWREGSCVVRKRILETPELFLKAQQQPQTPAATEAAALARDLEMTAAIVQRANRRMGVALTEMDGKQLEQALLDLDRMSLRMKDALSTLGQRNRKKDMLSQQQRTAIVELNAKKVSKREIARVLNISRPTVRDVLRSNSTDVPKILRAEKAEPMRFQLLRQYRQQILEFLSMCKGESMKNW